ncbi:hypothetical protein CJU90_0783 [Yarrowia sp. C11]|nr:hypothetical protein CJU90_0783 [Yarrowia sp. C11]
MTPITLEYELAEDGIYRLSKKPLSASPKSSTKSKTENPPAKDSRMRLGWIGDHEELPEVIRPYSDKQGSIYRSPKTKPKAILNRVLEGQRLERCGAGEWRHRCVFAVLGTTDKKDIARIKSSPVIQATTSLHFAEPHHFYLGHRRNRLPQHRYRDAVNRPPPGVNNVENEAPNRSRGSRL